MGRKKSRKEDRNFWKIEIVGTKNIYKFVFSIVK